MKGAERIFIALVVLILLSPTVLAEQTVKSIDIPLKYEQYSLANNIYYRNVTINPPDGISEIESIEFTLDGDFLSGTDVSGGILAGDTPVLCNPVTWKIPTWNVDNYHITFDCTDLVGNWKGSEEPLQFVWISDNIAGNIKPRVKMTYYNEPKASISVMGTEYQTGDDATLFLQLLDENKYPITNSSCFLTLLYPNKTIMIQDSLMVNSNTEGLYYKELTVPDIIGVYMASAKCYIPTLTYNVTTDITQTEGWESGDFCGGTGWSETCWANDDTGGSSIDAGDQHTGTYCLRLINSERYVHRGFNALEEEEVNVSFWAKVNSYEVGDESYFQFWDGSWKTIYEFNSTISDNTYHHYSFLLTADYYNIGNNQIQFITNPLVGTADYIYIDDIIIISGDREYYFINDTQYQVVRGSGEMHVSGLIEDIWTYTSRTLTDYNQSLIWSKLTTVIGQNNQIIALVNGLNNVSVADIWSYTGTVSSPLLSQVVQAVWQYTARYTHGIII
jgi:hypothetical protein